MKLTRSLILLTLAGLILSACTKESVYFKDLKDVGLRVDFNQKKSLSNVKEESPMTYETPSNYYVALKSARLIGVPPTEDFELFSQENLASSFVFDYTDDNVVHSLLQGTDVPEGEYTSIEIEIYYLQMNIAISTIERGVERRNFRIYLSDDAETEGGPHQPGDITQINGGIEIGWLLGEGIQPNMDPVTPRAAAYTNRGEGNSWKTFAGKPANDYGPFGDSAFMQLPHPVYKTELDFEFKGGAGDELILDFDVENCWEFEDKNGDGAFGPGDIDPLNPTMWNMQLPKMSVSLK